MNSEQTTRFDERLVHSFMDMLILRTLKEEFCKTGYEIVKYFHQKFGLMISPGTVYSMLYSLERQGLVEGSFDDRKRVYKLAKRGEEIYNEFCATSQHSNAVFRSIFPTE